MAMRKQHCSGDCGCSDVTRRSFVKLAAATTTTAALLCDVPAIFAGPFSKIDCQDHLIPANKKLSTAWLKSLYERGTPEVHKGTSLNFIGMPIGGICCGQVYLGGDGRLWKWDIFDSRYSSDYGGASMGKYYVTPHQQDENGNLVGFMLKTKSDGGQQIRSLDANGFSDVSFSGQYPIGRVNYAEPSCPVSIELEAFTPFIPLDHEESGLPATIMEFTVTNRGDKKVEFELAGWMRNSVLKNAVWSSGITRNRVQTSEDLVSLVCEPVFSESEKPKRSDIVFEDFESGDLDKWHVEGEAFQGGAYLRSEIADYQDVNNHKGNWLVNSHNARVGKTVGAADALTGRLLSKPFSIERDYINFLISGGRHPGQVCINVVIDGKTVATATGHNSNQMRYHSLHVAEHAGKNARIEITDQATGGWGNIGIDHIVFSDRPSVEKHLPGNGSMALSMLDSQAYASSANLLMDRIDDSIFDKLHGSKSTTADKPFGQPHFGALSSSKEIQPGESKRITFVVTWYFPEFTNVTGEFASITGIQKLQRHYAKRFRNARSVAKHVAKNYDTLSTATKQWNRVWYDSTLPYWFLDRTFVSLNCLATQTCFWFDNDRFYGWEGVTCCPGTCQHVWNYAQGLARIFPALERRVREHVDFGIGFRENGALDYRAEAGRQVATDGQCGTIVRAYREHLTSKDSNYLRRTWPKIKQSMKYIIAEDGEADGLLEGKQYNTLDQAWYGPMGWISSLYLSALAACEAMAGEMADTAFAQKCRQIIDAGRTNIVKELYDGEYFIHKPDPNFAKATNTNDGCHIDQVLGQSFCCQLGLPRVVPIKETKSALNAIWKYNFAPDAGAYRSLMQDLIKGGRPYAMEGEAGLVMTTWPKKGADTAGGEGGFETAKGYFNECMTGFEYQVAAHMIYEGKPGSQLVEQGLAITRAIHDRYHASKRNPYNEIECGDHYSRAMASFGVFLAVCGFDYHGPKGKITFSPRVSPENFRCPFVAAEGWGTFEQIRTDQKQTNRLQIRYGKLNVNEIVLTVLSDQKIETVVAMIDGMKTNATLSQRGAEITIAFPATKEIGLDQTLEIDLN